MRDKSVTLKGWLFASPYLIYSAVFFLVPVIGALFLTVTDWNMMSPDIKYVNLDNFIKAVKSPEIQAAFIVSYKFMAIILPTTLILSVGQAMLINSLPRYKNIFLVGYFLPYLASGVAIALVVKGVLAYDSTVNVWLRSIGIAIDWFNHPIFTPLVIALMITWKFSAYYILIIISGLESIPKEIYEAAKIDGAKPWTTFWKITVPMLYPALYTIVILTSGWMFGIFGEPYLLSRGGPGYGTYTWQLSIYFNAFQRLSAGYASSVAIIAAVVTFVSVLIIKSLAKGWGRKYGWE